MSDIYYSKFQATMESGLVAFFLWINIPDYTVSLIILKKLFHKYLLLLGSR